MSRHWKEILSEMNTNDAQISPLDLGDSWRDMPRRAEGVANKTKGLYRQSALPQQPVKNLYKVIIEKRPKPTQSNKSNEAAATQHPKIITTDLIDNNDTMNFSQFLSAKNNDCKTTSTPYPVRRIDVNKSPQRSIDNVQRRAADSPKKLFVPAPTRIPVSTPRTSRVASKVQESRVPYHQRSEVQRMSSPVVSSTVDNLSDDVESDPDVNAPVQNVAQSDRMSPTDENVKENCAPFHLLKQNAGTKQATDEMLFVRPQVVQRPAPKPNNLDANGGIAAEQSKSSIPSTSSQRSKKSKSKVDPLLDSYMKVGESISNKTSGGTMESSSSLSRHRLYRKGDSCNEDEILKGMETAQQKFSGPQTNELNVTRSVETHKSVPAESNAHQVIATPVKTTQLETNSAAATEATFTVHQSDQNEIEMQAARDNKARESLNNVQNDSETSDGEEDDNDNDDETDLPKANSIRTSNKRGTEEAVKEILQDWSVFHQQDNNADGQSDSDDSGESIRPIIEEKSLKESNVRQVRSEYQNDQEGDTVSSRAAREGQVHTSKQRIEDDVDSEEDELSIQSQPVRTDNQTSTKHVQLEETAAKEPVHSTHQREVVQDEYPDSDVNEPIMAEPLIKNTRTRREKKEKPDATDKSKLSKQSRSKQRHVESEKELPAKSQAKAKKKQVNVEKEVAETDGNEVPNGDDDNKKEAEQPNKPVSRGRKKRSNVDTDTTETDLPSDSNAKNKRTNVAKDVQNETEAEPPRKSRRKAKTKRSNVQVDPTDNPEIETEDNQPIVDNADILESTAKPKVRQSRKRKHQNDASMQPKEAAGGGDDAMSGSNTTVAQKRKKLSKWEINKITAYDSSQPREVVPGMRHSTRERRAPTTNLLLPILQTLSNRSALAKASSSRSTLRKPTSSRSTLQKATSSRSTLQAVDENDELPSGHSRCDDGETVISMLLNDLTDKEPPLITRLQDIEITQGFHRTVKNDLVIHHIPGETGPSYGYFRLEPGMVKRACRITWTLHIHVVKGPVQITTEGGSETMQTGSFASLHKGTKYSLRNDGENVSLIFFSQHLIESSS